MCRRGICAQTNRLALAMRCIARVNTGYACSHTSPLWGISSRPCRLYGIPEDPCRALCALPFAEPLACRECPTKLDSPPALCCAVLVVPEASTSYQLLASVQCDVQVIMRPHLNWRPSRFQTFRQLAPRRNLPLRCASQKSRILEISRRCRRASRIFKALAASSTWFILPSSREAAQLRLM